MNMNTEDRERAERILGKSAIHSWNCSFPRGCTCSIERDRQTALTLLATEFSVIRLEQDRSTRLTIATALKDGASVEEVWRMEKEVWQIPSDKVTAYERGWIDALRTWADKIERNELL